MKTAIEPINLAALAEHYRSMQDLIADFVNTCLTKAVVGSALEPVFYVPEEFSHSVVTEVLTGFEKAGYRVSGSEWVLSYHPEYSQLFVNRTTLSSMIENASQAQALS